MRHIHCDRRVLDAIVDHARRDAPRECCGVLLGSGETIVDALATRNLAESDTRFLIEPEGHIAARRTARTRGLSVVGFYHSHPRSPALPSERDLAEATSYPDAVHAIVSLALDAPDVKLFVLADGRFEEVALAG